MQRSSSSAACNGWVDLLFALFCIGFGLNDVSMTRDPHDVRMNYTTPTSAPRRALSLLIAMGLLAAGCGSGSSSDTPEASPDAESPTTQSETTEPETTESPAPVTTEAPAESAPETAAPSESPDEADVAPEAYELDLGDGIVLTVPAGGPTDVSATPIDAESTDPEAQVIAAFELLPDGAVFDDPVLMSLPIPEYESGAGAELQFTLTSADGTVESVGGSVDGDRIVYEIPHFTKVTVERVLLTNLITFPTGPQPVVSRFQVQFDGLQNAAIDWDAIVHLGTDSEAVKVIDRSTATLECAKPGTSHLIFLSRDIYPGGTTRTSTARLTVTCVEPEGVTADQVSLTENHTDPTLLTDAGWFSVIVALFEGILKGLVAPVLDTDCNGLIDAGDRIIFEPVPVDSDGMAVMGIERFGCYGVAIFNADETFEPDTFPFELPGPPTLSDNGTWEFPAALQDVEIELVDGFESGDPAVWEVTGTDGEMPLIP